MDIYSIYTLIGGLAFFLYGMTIMSQGLEKIAGGEYEKLSHCELFGGLACLAFLTFVILLFFIPKLNKTLKINE